MRRDGFITTHVVVTNHRGSALRALQQRYRRVRAIDLMVLAGGFARARVSAGAVGMIVLAMVIFAISVAFTAAAHAQRGDLRSSGLNPFPKDDIYRLHLFGDWLTDGIEPALKSSIVTIPRVQVQGPIVELRSLRRSNWDAAVDAIEQRAKSTPIDIAVVMFGISEIGSVFVAGRERYRLGSEAWLKEYASRVDRVMKALRSSKGAVYWIGLPVVRRRDHSEAYQVVNTVVRERAYANGVTFIDIFSRFQDENGGFNRYGPDLDGTIKLMRSRDGIYFTRDGNAKIAHLVMQMLRRDLNRVKSERVVTLAGSEAEQSSVRRLRAPRKAVKSVNTGVRSAAAKPTGNKAPGGGLALVNRFGGVKADNGSYELERVVNNKPEKIVLKLPRPALSAAVIALVTRSQSKDKPASYGDNAVHVVEGGVPLLSTVTPADQSALALRKRRLSPTQSVFFKVWGKGERLEPKPGRADDFEWPRPEPKPVVHVTAKSSGNGRRSGSLLPQARDPNLPPLPVQDLFR